MESAIIKGETVMGDNARNKQRAVCVLILVIYMGPMGPPLNIHLPRLMCNKMQPPSNLVQAEPYSTKSYG